MKDGFAWPIIALTVVIGWPCSVSQIEPAEWRRLCHESLPSPVVGVGWTGGYLQST